MRKLFRDQFLTDAKVNIEIEIFKIYKKKIKKLKNNINKKVIIDKSNVEIGVHQLIIESRAPLLLSSSSNQTVIHIDNYSTEIVKYFLEFLYSYTIEIPKEFLADLKKLSQQYALSELVAIIDSLPVDNSSK